MKALRMFACFALVGLAGCALRGPAYVRNFGQGIDADYEPGLALVRRSPLVMSRMPAGFEVSNRGKSVSFGRAVQYRYSVHSPGHPDKASVAVVDVAYPSGKPRLTVTCMVREHAFKWLPENVDLCSSPAALKLQ